MARYGLLAAFLRFAPLLSYTVVARVVTETVEVSNDVSAVLLATEFGIAAGGYIGFDVDVDEGRRRRRRGGDQSDRDYRGYIVVVGKSTTDEWYKTLLDFSTLEVDDPPPVCVAPSTGRFEVTESGSFNMSIVKHDLYSAYFLVCGGDKSFYGEVTSTFINRDPEGGLTQHLPIELAMLPALYSLMGVVYVGLTGAWIGEMARLRPHVLPVHFLCLMCVVVKTVEIIVVAVYYSRQSEKGEKQERIRVAAILLASLFLVSFLLTLLLLSLGWGFIRTTLRSKEGWLVTLTVGFYAGISLIEAGCQSSETDWCGGVALMEYAVRSLIMLSTVVAINFNITHIRFCIQLPWTSSSVLEYLKLSRYLSFRLTFLAYLLLPTALLVVKLTILSWEYDWVYNGLEEFVTMIILVHLGTTFAPLDPWLLTRGFDHSLEQDTS